ncbi:GP46-like surface antigen, putative [Bodo saltans]|uniref:protein-tyrosine-phosphatase n=1 Tax=Bodo saltans TaxID=75058 RepID=A0A0S4J5S1_BODSA|nr:GP46-like surface antigen, putative [Bodo saltans]|eukprot:CUG84719.1 GP46-like surface antigen, putative [Bodo saltans]
MGVCISSPSNNNRTAAGSDKKKSINDPNNGMQAVGPQDNATVAAGKQNNNGGNPLTSTSHNNNQQQQPKTDVSTNGTHLPTDDSEEGCGQTVTNTVSAKTTNGVARQAGQPINNGSFADSQKDNNSTGNRVVTTTGSTYSARPEDHRAEQMRNAGSFAGGPDNSNNNNNNNPAHGIIVEVEIPTDAQHSHDGEHDEDFGGSDEDDLLEDSALRPGRDYVATMSEFAVGESVGDKYEVMEVLKCGTVGRTYRARSTAHDAQCVFKVVCFLSREELVESVRDAQKVLTRLQHANVLPVFDVMEDANHENMIIVTSYVPNRNVSRHCGLLLPGAGGGGTHEIEHLRMMLRDIGVGIRVLHSHHVYHHNIKLENILETKDGGCCVADAGYSSLFSSQPLEVLLDLQNGGLIPPEYFLEDYDLTQASAAARIDTWSFGWVMYELAYGAPPYEITNDMSVEDVRRLVISHKLKCPIETTNAPNDLWEVIKWSLEKKPKDRPTVMKLLRHQFFRIANGQSFVEPGNSSSFAAGSMMHVHKSLTVEHTGFVMSVVLGKGPHAENFLVHMPNMPNKVFVLKCFSDSLASRMQHLETPQIFSLRKHLAITRKIRHPTIAHTYEIVDNEENTYATQRYFARGNLAINFPALEQGGLVIRMIADVLRGLARLHDVAIYHLNLKPSNVFYTDDEFDHHFVLSDFWDQLYAAINPTSGGSGMGDVVDVERVLGRLVLRQQQNPQTFPKQYMEFVTMALTSCKTVRELMDHPFLASEITAADRSVTYFDVLDDDITKAIRDKFVCRNENRLADLLGHGGFLAPGVAIPFNVGGLARCVSAQSMTVGEGRRPSYNTTSPAHGNNNDDAMSVSLQERSIIPSEFMQKISYAFMDKMCCGLCKKELKYVVYRCAECSDYLRCGKCVSVDDHGHALNPMVIENVCHADADDEDMKVATLVAPAALNKHALEEIEMQAELPAGMLLAAARAAGGGARSSFRGKHNNRRDMVDTVLKSGGDGPALSRAGSMSIGQLSNTANGHRGARHNPSSDDPMDDDDDVERGGDTHSVAGVAAPAPKKGLLQEHEANEDTNPITEIELCRQNNEPELMLHNFGLVDVPPQMFDPPLSHIIHLNLSNNSLVELPHDVSFLHNLQRLSLANNKLESLPDSVGDLGELQYLDVSHNALEDLPQSLMFADKLETIAMDYNNCSEIPGVILDMPQMRIIYLAENRKINKWPPVSQLVAIGPMKLGLDNEPLLWKEFHEIQHQLQSRVTVMWNKIYPDEIIPHLFCGSLRSAQSLAVYDRLNITYLLTVGRGLEPTVIPDMHHKVVIVDDIEGATIDHSFQDAVSFIDDSLKSQQGCLVHCFAGMSRSATTVIAYLMIRKGMRLDEAYCTTRRGRPAIYPNGGFFAQLLALDAKLYPGGRPLDMPSMERHIIPST